MVCLIRLVAVIVFAHRLNKNLEETEKEHSICQRWSENNKEYKECMYTLLLGKKEQLLSEMWKARAEESIFAGPEKKICRYIAMYVL